MGLYDSFYVKAKCPRCGQEEVFEFQTKVFLNRALWIWKEGEEFNHPEIEIKDGKIKRCITIHENCPNPAYEDEDRRFTTFYGDIIIKDGKVIGVENIEEEKE